MTYTITNNKKFVPGAKYIMYWRHPNGKKGTIKGIGDELPDVIRNCDRFGIKYNYRRMNEEGN